jgi:Predicted membrane protein
LSGSGRLLLLLAGLLGYGLSLRLMIAAQVGVAPWEVLHLGLSGRSGLRVGEVSILVGLVLLAYTRLKLGERLGVGTLLNVLLIGVFLDAFAPLIHTPAARAGAQARPPVGARGAAGRGGGGARGGAGGSVGRSGGAPWSSRCSPGRAWRGGSGCSGWRKGRRRASKTPPWSGGA